jgi:UDP-N-acetylglucosamine enolpyruvyl transferase
MGARFEITDEWIVASAPHGLRAAAVADRPSVLRGIDHIERGYHRPSEQFASLGLTIRRGEGPR